MKNIEVTKDKKTWSKPKVQVLKINSDSENGMAMGAETLVMLMLGPGS